MSQVSISCASAPFSNQEHAIKRWFVNVVEPGQYTLWCAVNAHRSLGMQGALTVQ